MRRNKKMTKFRIYDSKIEAVGTFIYAEDSITIKVGDKLRPEFFKVINKYLDKNKFKLVNAMYSHNITHHRRGFKTNKHFPTYRIRRDAWGRKNIVLIEQKPKNIEKIE